MVGSDPLLAPVGAHASERIRHDVKTSIRPGDIPKRPVVWANKAWPNICMHRLANVVVIEQTEPPPVAVLTSQARQTWAQVSK